ncbi:tripartite tricarboxylate transporter substrate binding protein [Cupriavidus basilensis]|uniref:tripartite tricarboxylate transporter substrate binding protein n=1 Tax=Cupriavidus basilensis TaxID=68895 RepID=UPI00157BB0BD|nr:tripartite tricarboxylate transporter substrate binding protein [Cupriavidus basilensis]NUA31978.1 tripartite tricarboxylate transporter substrate binding protein [Cupriavidus basilensis]
MPSRRTACKWILSSLAGAAGATALSSAFGAASDAYPDKPIRIVVPYTPGGFNDTLARTVGERLTKLWKQPVVVDNRPGGNTLIGNSMVAKAAPDGYTLLITPLPFAALPALYGAKLPYNATKDFTPVIWAASTQNVLVARNDLGLATVKDIVDFAKKNPGKLNYGSTGSGSSNHLSMELFEKMTGTKLTHVPYKGSGPAVVALLGGEIDVLFDNLPNVMTQIRAGKFKPVALTGQQRSTLLPNVPTVSESGVPGYDVNVWFGIQAPAGTPKEVVQKLNQEIAKALADADVVKRFREQGVEVVGSSPTKFATLVEAEIQKWGSVVRDANVRLE